MESANGDLRRPIGNHGLFVLKFPPFLTGLGCVGNSTHGMLITIQKTLQLSVFKLPLTPGLDDLSTPNRISVVIICDNQHRIIRRLPFRNFWVTVIIITSIAPVSNSTYISTDGCVKLFRRQLNHVPTTQGSVGPLANARHK